MCKSLICSPVHPLVTVRHPLSNSGFACENIILYCPDTIFISQTNSFCSVLIEQIRYSGWEKSMHVPFCQPSPNRSFTGIFIPNLISSVISGAEEKRSLTIMARSSIVGSGLFETAYRDLTLTKPRVGERQSPSCFGWSLHFSCIFGGPIPRTENRL